MESKWQETTLGDIAVIKMGQSPKGDTCNTQGEGIALLNGPTEFGSNHPTPTQFSTDPKRFAKKGDLLFCVRGSTTGRMNWANQEYAIGRGLAALHHKGGIEYQPYLKAIIDYNLPKLLVTATGSTFPNVSKNQLHDLELNIPTLDEQKRIAHILGSLDDKIELNRQMNQTLEQMAQALFKSWFVDFDPVIDNALVAGNPIPEELRAKAEKRKDLGKERKALPVDIQKLFPDEFEYSDELEKWVPRGWKLQAVNECLEINPKVKLTKGSFAKFVDMKALPTSGYSISGIITKELTSGGSKFNQGDVLLARITPCLENGKTGIVDFLSENEAAFGSTEFIVMRGKDAIKTPFVACLARDYNFRKHCMQSMVGSSGRQRVQNACFSNYFVAIPEDKRILNLFDEQTKDNFQHITQNNNQIHSITSLRDTLLPKLISGEVRVPEVEKMIE